MTIVVSDNGNYAVKAKLVEVAYPSDTVALVFTSQFYGASDPIAEQHKLTLFLTADERQRLKDML